MSFIKNKVTGILVLLLTGIEIINLIIASLEDKTLKFSNTLPWSLFYNSQLFGENETTIHLFVFTLTLPIIFCWMFIYAKNHANVELLTRLDYKELLAYGIKTIFWSAFLFRIFLIIVDIITISLAFHPLSFSSSLSFESGTAFELFDSSTLVQFLLYTLVTAIGWGIISCFFFTVFLFVNKTILIIPSAILIDLLLVIIPALIPAKSSWAQSLLYIPMISNLQAPGNLTLHGQNTPLPLILIYFMSLLFYLIISLILAKTYVNYAKRGIIK